MQFAFMSFETNSMKECELACEKMADCIAFDVGSDNNECYLRFSSNVALESQPNYFGYNSKPCKGNRCCDGCNATMITGNGRGKGGCWRRVGGKDNINLNRHFYVF